MAEAEVAQKARQLPYVGAITEALREVILELCKRGTTVVLSTHDMAVAERMCDRVLMLHLGRRCSMAKSIASSATAVTTVCTFASNAT